MLNVVDKHLLKKDAKKDFQDHILHVHIMIMNLYRCINQYDRWVVPYHAPTLLIWKAHMNAQYVTDKGLAKYINKYIAKTEPSHLFNVREGNLFHEYIHARRLGSMELM